MEKTIATLNPSLHKLKDTIKRIIGFDSHKYTDTFLKRRIDTRLKAKNASSYAEYEQILLNDKEEQKNLVSNLTINVTEFFRDDTFWKTCKEKFFPDLLTIFKDKKTITFWSAGCSSGQEAISILLTFLEINPMLKDRIKIIGTDIDEEALNEARIAEYDSFGYKGLGQNYVEKYFDKKNDGKLALKYEYKKNFEFKKHDVLSEAPLKDANIIFCRNTVIYFSKDAKEDLYQRLYKSMDNPSFFIIGKTETLIGPSRDLFKVYDSYERIFEKNPE